MYYLNEFCCICFDNGPDLIKLSKENENGVTYFQKLTECVPEMNSNEVGPDKTICSDCVEGLEEVWLFRTMCIENKIIFLDYLTTLRENGQKNGTLSIRVQDMNDIKVQNIKDESHKLDIEKPHISKKIKLNVNETKMKTQQKENHSNNSLFKITDIKTEKLDTIEDHLYLNGDEDNSHLLSSSSCSNNSLESKSEFVQKLSCKYCKENFIDRTKFESHPCKDNVYLHLDCKHCYKVFKTELELCEHFCEGYEKQNSFKCESCDITLPSLAKLLNHQEVRHGLAKHKCRICEKKFAQLIHLRDHLVNEHKVKPLTCDICGKTYSHSRDLNTHVNRHKGWKPFECNVCERKFYSRGELKRHSKSHQ